MHLFDKGARQMRRHVLAGEQRCNQIARDGSAACPGPQLLGTIWFRTSGCILGE